MRSQERSFELPHQGSPRPRQAHHHTWMITLVDFFLYQEATFCPPLPTSPYPTYTLLCSYFQGLLALPHDKLTSFQIGSLNNSRGASFSVNSVCYGFCTVFANSTMLEIPQTYLNPFSNCPHHQRCHQLEVKIQRILFFKVHVWKSRIFWKHVACTITSPGHQEEGLQGINLVLSLECGSVSQQVEDLELIGKEYVRARALTFSLGAPKSHSWAIAASRLSELSLLPPERLLNVGNIQGWLSCD